MDREHSFLADPSGTREEIMRATYLALCEHGYADLTIQRIGEGFEKSVSLLYQHYDGKDELLLEFLSFMLDEFERSLPPLSEDDPATHLDAVLDHAFATDPSTERREFEAAMVELRAQAAADERYRERFTSHDRFFQDRLVRVLRAGIDDGTFRDVDPEAVVAFLFAAIESARTLRATSTAVDVGEIRAGVDAYLDAVVYAPE